MYMMLCSTTDTSAQWAASGLAGLLPGPLEVVLAETLADGATWEHRVSSDAVHLKVALADGRVICGSKIKGVVNRLMVPPQARVRWPSEVEQGYVHGEVHAFHLSWLHGLPCVMLNRPSPSCMGGRYFRASEWMYRASMAGLKTVSYLQSDDDGGDGYSLSVPEGVVRQSVIVAGECVFPAWLPAQVKTACVQLARDTEMELMGVELYLDEIGEWCFAGGNSNPDLVAGGMPLLECLAAMLQKGDAR
jgi:hypothetical protein